MKLFSINKTNIIRIFLFIIFIAASVYILTTAREKSYYYSYNISNFTKTDGNFRSPQSSIRLGSYELNVIYSSDKDIPYCIQLGSDNEIKGVLPAKSRRAMEVIPFTADIDCDNLFINFYDTTYEMNLTDVLLESEDPLNTDIYVRFSVLTLTFVLLWIMTGKYSSMSHTDKQVLLILSGSVIFLNLIYQGDTIKFSGDIRFHLTRINGIKNAIEQGQFPAVLFPNSFNGHGEIGALYPNLFLYPAGFLRACGVSLMMVNKLMMCLINIFTVLITYFCLKSVTDNKLHAAIATTVYSLFPYRIFVMTTSGSAAGRGLALMFLPLFIVGINRLVKTNIKYSENMGFYIRSVLMLAIGASGILNTHVLCFIMAIIFAVLYCLFNYKHTFRKDTLLSILSGGFLTFLLGHITIALLIGYIDSGLNIGYLEHDLYIKLDSPAEYIRNPWTIFSIALVLLTIAILLKNKIKPSNNLIVSVIGIIVISILTLNIIPYNYLMQYSIFDKILSMFQNMKRLYFISSILSTYCIMQILEICKSAKQKKLVTAYTFTILIICAFMSGEAFVKSDSLADSVVAYTEHEGALEYLPEGTKVSDFTTNVAYVSNESALNVIYYDKEGYDATVYYTCTENGVYAELPMFYYNDTKCQDEDGNPLPISKGNKNHVRIYFDRTDTVKCINVFYRFNPIYTLIFILSIGSYVIVFIVVLIEYLKKRKNGVIGL